MNGIYYTSIELMVYFMDNRLSDVLLEQWHPIKNGILLPSQVTSGSRKKIWWRCRLGHEWECPVRERGAGGCPFCSGQRVLAGFNDLASLFPNLAGEWSSHNPLSASAVTAGSNKQFYWTCPAGHEWLSSPSNRKRGRNCHYCSNKKVLAGFNDAATTHPYLVAELAQSNRNHLTEVTAGSNQKFVWVCRSKHEWTTSVRERAKGKNCPYCANVKPLEGFNDLFTTNPNLFQQLHPSKNEMLDETKIIAGSKRKVWWLGDCGHEWEAAVQSRSKGTGCPVCAGNSILQGFNDAGTLHPYLIEEWDNENNEFTLHEVTAGSGTRFTWKCQSGHSWIASVKDRIFYRTGCPECAAQSYISQPEKELFAFLSSLGLQVEQSNRSVLKGIRSNEIDLYIPEKKFGVEFNGLYWHSEAQGKGKTYHEAKYKAAKEASVQLVQIWEDDWTRNPELVKHLLAHKLGVSVQKKVFARKTSVSTITKTEAELFLNENHIQGYSSGSYYVALKHDDKVAALLVLRKEGGENEGILNIIRYATSANVVGGFTKLLKYVEKTYEPEGFITFADHMVSDGGLYESNGFIADKILPPEYMYVVGNERKHKFGYRLKRFQNDPELLWEDGLTERELAALNGLERVWDAGKTRYRKIL